MLNYSLFISGEILMGMIIELFLFQEFIHGLIGGVQNDKGYNSDYDWIASCKVNIRWR